MQEIDLSTVEATEEEKAGWTRKFQAEAEAKEQVKKLKEAQGRLEDLRAAAESTKIDLEKSFPDTLLSWTLGDIPRKEVDDLRKSIVRQKDLIGDCEAALLLVEKKIPTYSRAIQHADITRFQIEERARKAERAAKDVAA